MRAFVVVCLFMTAGRSSEVAWMTWDAMMFCFFFLCTFSSLPQAKVCLRGDHAISFRIYRVITVARRNPRCFMVQVSETKVTCFVSGTSRHDCWYLTLGDYLALNADRTVFEEDAPQWVFPHLQDNKYPGTVISSYIKALQPPDRGGLARYKEYAGAILRANGYTQRVQFHCPS